MSFTRSDRSLASEWWFTVDRAVLTVVLAMVAAGLVLSLAASPSVAIRKGYPTFYFVERHLLFAGAGVVLMLAASLLSPRQVRRAALALIVVTLVLMLWVIVHGPEINGAKRWLRFGGLSLQPSELAKPGFVVISAWLLAESRRRPDTPALGLAVLLLAAVGTVLLLQPDIGQTLLFTLAWGAMFFLSGHRVVHAAVVGGAGLACLGIAYLSLDYVKKRIDRFIDPASGDNFQVDKALQSFSEGGLLGRGPGEGTVKTVLPDAHTDFIFAVIGEEYGAIACLALIAIFGFVLVRAFRRAASEHDAFVRLAVMGLAFLLAVQAAINMSVNVGLLPAKGMTLPFISSGGSSHLAVSLTVGFLLALMRRRPDPRHVGLPVARARIDTIEI